MPRTKAFNTAEGFGANTTGAAAGGRYTMKGTDDRKHVDEIVIKIDREKLNNAALRNSEE